MGAAPPSPLPVSKPKFVKPSLTEVLPVLVYNYEEEAKKATPQIPAEFRFPEGEVSIVQTPFVRETVEPPVPDVNADTPLYLRSSFQFWSDGWNELVVPRNHLPPKALSGDEIPKLNYDTNLHVEEEPPLSTSMSLGSSMGFSSESEPGTDKLLFESVKQRTTYQQRADARVTGRKPLLRLTQRDQENLPEDIAVPPVLKRAANITNLFKPAPQITALMEPRELAFDIGDLEPIWCTIAVYDVHLKRRVSENYTFSLNSVASDKMLDLSPAQVARNNRKGIFTFTPSADLFFVLRLEKVLQGSLDDIGEAYGQGSTCKEKVKDKLKASITDAAARLRLYRQPFGWSIADAPLFASMDEGFPSKISFAPIFKQRTDISDEAMLESIAAGGAKATTLGMRKQKTLRGMLSVDVKILPEPHPLQTIMSPSVRIITPSHQTLVDHQSPAASSQPSGGPINENGQLIRHVQEFSSQPRFLPHMQYFNNLYIYPQSLAYQKGGNHLVRVYILDSDRQAVIDPRSLSGLPHFYDSMTAQKNKPYVSTAIQYKAKAPTFYDEFKVDLPHTISASHHLLFVVIRVETKPPKKNQPANPESPIGFAFLPLMKENSFTSMEHELQLASELPEHYLSLPPTSLRLLENGKIVLKVRLQLCSTVLSHDRPLSKALSLFSSVQSGGSGGTDRLKNKQSLTSLQEVDPLLIMHHFPGILHHLLALNNTEPFLASDSILALSSLIQSLLSYSSETHPLLLSYVYHLFNPSRYQPDLFASLARSWLTLLSEANAGNESLIHAAPFFFAIIFKVLVHRKAVTAAPIDADHLTILYRLGLQIIFEAQERSTNGIVAAKDLVYSFGLFLTDMFDVLDKGFVIHMIHHVITHIAPPPGDHALIDFKFAFIRTVSQYRNWLAVNLPVQLVVGTAQLRGQLLSQHFLVSLLLTNVSQTASHKEQSVRLQSIATLRYLLHDHHTDPRFSNAESRARIAELYFPFIILLSDRIHLFQSSSMAEKRGVLICFLYILHDVSPKILQDWWMSETPQRLHRFFSVVELAMEVFEYHGEAKMLALMGVDSSAQISSGTKAMLEHMYTTGVSPQQNRPASSPGTARLRSHKAKDNTGSVSNRYGKTPRPAGYCFDEAREMHFSTECSLIVLDILERFVEHCSDELIRKQAPSYDMLKKIVHLYVLFLRVDESTEVLAHYHPALRALVHRFADVIFLNKSTEFVSGLIPGLVTHCNCASKPVRTAAALDLFLLMNVNYETVGGNFVRFTVQATKAVALLSKDDTYLRRALGAIAKHTSGGFSMATHRSTEPAASAKSTFSSQASELMARFDTILENGRRINQHADDLEFKHDLMVKVAQSYCTVPDLRVACLDRLAKDHARHGHWAEAAMCYLHLAALSAENLTIRHTAAVQKAGQSPSSPSPSSSSSSSSSSSASAVTAADGSIKMPDDYLEHHRWPVGIAAIATAISSNIGEEVLPPDIVLRDTDSVCEDPIFHAVPGLLATLHQAIKSFHQATLWESVFQTSKLLLPIYEHQRNFKEMSSIFLDLKKCFAQIASDQEARTRTLGVYYRVVFLGKIFGESSGIEYVYKMPLLTRLGEIKERLEQINRNRHGAENIEIWPRNEPIPADKLTPGKGWIQLTSVRPYFEVAELAKSRVTYYEQSTNISRFVYETAFTTGTSKHADSMADQWKRQTIVTTEKQFPYIKTRLRVVSSAVIELSPIQGSIDTIAQQTNELLAEITATETNTKILQRLLQGSLLVQVQAGPKAIALAFFDEKVNSSFDPHLLEELRNAFRKFIKACREAVSFNRLISPDSVALQEELEAAYTSFDHCLQDMGVIESRTRRFTGAGPSILLSSP